MSASSVVLMFTFHKALGHRLPLSSSWAMETPLVVSSHFTTTTLPRTKLLRIDEKDAQML
jgi:hypothetical protein